MRPIGEKLLQSDKMSFPVSQILWRTVWCWHAMLLSPEVGLTKEPLYILTQKAGPVASR